jgi:hypothetical protein
MNYRGGVSHLTACQLTTSGYARCIAAKLASISEIQQTFGGKELFILIGLYFCYASLTTMLTGPRINARFATLSHGLFLTWRG